MPSGEPRALVDVLTQEEPAILAGWLRRQADAARRLGDDPEIPTLSRDFLRRLRSALQTAMARSGPWIATCTCRPKLLLRHTT